MSLCLNNSDSTTQTLLDFETVGFNGAFQRRCLVGWLDLQARLSILSTNKIIPRGLTRADSRYFPHSTSALDSSITVLQPPVCSSHSTLGFSERLCMNQLERESGCFSMFRRAFFNSVIEKTPTHALLSQHCIIE